MGRWDATLPYISPGRGLSGPDSVGGASALRRGRVLGSPRSASPATSSSGSDTGGDDELPDVEDIYDWTTPQLAALEAKLATKAAGAAPREKRLHELVRVELSERRGVEEIGLALMGGRFDLERVPITAPVLAQEASTGPRQPLAATRSPRARPSHAEAQPLLTDAPSPSASSRSAPSRACSPSLGKRFSHSSPMTSTADTATQRSSFSGGASLNATDPPSGSKGSAAFKPTPVNFDFVIGGSSVKKKKLLAKPKKKPPEEKPAKQDSRKPPLAPGRQAADQRGGSISTRQAGGNGKSAPAPAATSGTSSRSTSQDTRKNSKAAPKVVPRCPSTSSTSASASGMGPAAVEEVAARRPSTSSTTASGSGLVTGAMEQAASPSQSSPGGSSSPPEGSSLLDEVASPGQPDDQFDDEELRPSTGSEARRLRSPVSDEERRPEDVDKEPAEVEEDDEKAQHPPALERPGCCTVLPSILCEEEPLDSARTAPDSCIAATGGREEETLAASCGSCQASPVSAGATTSASGELSRTLQSGRREPGPSSVDPERQQEAATRTPVGNVSPLATHLPSPASSPRRRRPSPCGWEEWGSEGEGATVGCEAGGSEPSTSPRRQSPTSARRETTAGRGGYPPEAELLPDRAVPAVHAGQPPAAAATGKAAGGQAKEASATATRNTTRARERHARRPPLPHEALKPREAPRIRNELDLMGLDPELVERGEVTSYVDHFTSAASFFTWGLQQGGEALPKREHYLREAMQLFQQFCEIIGSLEVQFTDELAPADHATPGATQQALSAMGSRGAGLYGVFLKGIIDKMSDAPVESVPRPLARTSRDVCSLRYYKVVQSRTEVYDIVTRVFHRKNGWEELPHGLGLSNSWNLCWTWSKPKLDYSRLCCWQKVNHFPENKHLTRKDCLKRCIERYTKSSGKHAQFFNICPRTFVLPKEYCLFIECFSKVAEENGELDDGKHEPKDARGHQPKFANLWIMKPAGSSRGRGIQVVNDVGSVHYGELTIIQQYISNPFLLGGYKWDMRTYVTVTSFNPLEAFIYKDGFARFTTVPYTTDAGDIDNKFVHLTNSSIQRHNEDSMMQGDHCDAVAQARQRDAMLGGTKIAFKALRDRLTALGVEWSVVWGRMIEVILKSLCMAEDHIPSQVNSFELFGYDLLLDTNLRVWLIEVNASPSMGQEHLLDEQVKQPLISDTIDLVDPMAFDRRRLAEVLHRRVERKAGAAGGRQQLDIDAHAVLKGKAPRKFGEMPHYMGNYERIAPSDVCDSILRTRSQLFNKQ